MTALLDTLRDTLRSFFGRTERAADADDAYLREAVDLHDLERRMRALDRRARDPLAAWLQAPYRP